MCPLSVKIIAVLCMILSVLLAIPKVFVLLNPEVYEGARNLVEAMSSQAIFPVPFAVQIYHSLLGVFIVFISGVYMLKGKSWALYLLTAWILVSLLLNFLIVGASSYFLIELVLPIIILTVLYTGKSRAYLLGR